MTQFRGQRLRIRRSNLQLGSAEPFDFGFASHFGLWQFSRWYLFLRRTTAYELAHFIYQTSYWLKGLGQGVVRANSARLLFVEWLEGANKKHNRNVLQPVVLFDVLTDFVAIDLRHEDIRENHIRGELFQPLNRLTPIVNGNYADAFVGKSKTDNFLDRDGIVGE